MLLMDGLRDLIEHLFVLHHAFAPTLLRPLFFVLDERLEVLARSDERILGALRELLGLANGVSLAVDTALLLRFEFFEALDESRSGGLVEDLHLSRGEFVRILLPAAMTVLDHALELAFELLQEGFFFSNLLDGAREGFLRLLFGAFADLKECLESILSHVLC